MIAAAHGLVRTSPGAAHAASGPGDVPVPIGEPEDDEGYADDEDDDDEDDDEEPMQLVPEQAGFAISKV